MENLANGETFFRSQVDDLSFAVARSVSPANIGEAKVSTYIYVAHV